MNSRIVGHTQAEPEALAQEAARILELKFNAEYKDYVFGTWKNCVLWNQSGDSQDSTLKAYDGLARPTELARDLRLTQDILGETFDLRYLKWMRVFVQERGVLLPHRDYLEMDDSFSRLHIPLQTDITCLHSEEEQVYHMRAGEIWWLDASEVHSAAALTDTCRVSLCLDFAPGVPLRKILRQWAVDRILPEPCVIERPPIPEDIRKSLLRFSEFLDDSSFREIVGCLSELHFHFGVGAAAIFDWMDDLAARSGRPGMIERAERLRNFAILGRSLGERLATA